MQEYGAVQFLTALLLWLSSLYVFDITDIAMLKVMGLSFGVVSEGAGWGEGGGRKGREGKA